MKYWSIGARISEISFFHPLWLPKLILDSHQEKLRKQGVPSLGNDGLVTVDSAMWGDFLGALEECDHWDIRGAGGLSAHIDDGKEKSGMGRSEENKWSWNDWQRFLGVWGQDKTRRKANERLGTGKSSTEEEKKTERAIVFRTLGDPGVKQRMVDEVKERESSKGESGSSTMDNLLDWVVDNVPGVRAVREPIKSVLDRTAIITSGRKKETIGEKVGAEMKPPRFDLERFYVALSRKLYDEGL